MRALIFLSAALGCVLLSNGDHSNSNTGAEAYDGPLGPSGMRNYDGAPDRSAYADDEKRTYGKKRLCAVGLPGEDGTGTPGSPDKPGIPGVGKPAPPCFEYDSQSGTPGQPGYDVYGQLDRDILGQTGKPGELLRDEYNGQREGQGLGIPGKPGGVCVYNTWETDLSCCRFEVGILGTQLIGHDTSGAPGEKCGENAWKSNLSCCHFKVAMLGVQLRRHLLEKGCRIANA